MRDASDSPFLYEVGKGGWGDRGLRLKLAHRVSYRLIDLIVGELALSEAEIEVKTECKIVNRVEQTGEDKVLIRCFLGK